MNGNNLKGGANYGLSIYYRIKNKKLRENMELSQSQLAEMVGYKDKTSIAKIEAGKVDLPQSKILAFSKALNVTPADLLDFDLCLTNNNQVICIETAKSNSSNFINLYSLIVIN